MKPMKFLSPFADWLMRAGVLLFVIFYYVNTVKAMNFSTISFWISLGFLIFCVLLFAGGFVKSSNLTVTSALVLTILSGYQLFNLIGGGINYNFSVFILLSAVFVRFLAKGNNS